MSGSCHLDRASNVEIGVECQIFGIKKFKCDICDYITAQSAHLKMHIKSVHKESRHLSATFVIMKPQKNYILKEHIVSVHEVQIIAKK